MSRVNGRYWIGTIPSDQTTSFPTGPYPEGINFVKGQQESGASGYLHWQVVVGYRKPCRLSRLRKDFGNFHWEITRSKAAEDYVWKEETAVPGTKFQWGQKALKRNSATDWSLVKENAKRGKLDDIPEDIYVRCYNQLRRIAADNAKPVAMERTVRCYWGKTGSGKTRRAWEDFSGQEVYVKDPCTKWWDGYQGEGAVIIDEFRGLINISHMLRWLDRYPVRVETKGASMPLDAKEIVITSNLDPKDWYKDIDYRTQDALERRMTISEMN